MKTRLITALVLVAILVPLIFISNPYPIMIVGAIIVGIGSYEYKKLTNSSSIYIGLNIAIYLNMVIYYNAISNFLVLKGLAIILLIASLMLVIRDSKVEKWINPIFNLIYIGLGAGTLVTLKLIDVNLLVYLAMVIAATDSFAYFFGIRYGKHRLAPTISPKKSVEGAIAGTIAATVIGSSFLYYVVGMENFVTSSFLGAIAISCLASITGQFGDLFASKIKRHYGVKDFGNIFPGHGGVLDRFDSLLLASMIMLLLIF